MMELFLQSLKFHSVPFEKNSIISHEMAFQERFLDFIKGEEKMTKYPAGGYTAPVEWNQDMLNLLYQDIAKQGYAKYSDYVQEYGEKAVRT